MKRVVMLLVTGAFLLGVAAPAVAGPEDVIRWLKDPCVPTGDLEDDCRLPRLND
jgi:hypothetical protein